MNLQQLKKGDIVFIADSNEKNISSLGVGYGGLSYYHCGIYIGGGKLIEAVESDGVIADNIAKYRAKKILIARVELATAPILKVIQAAQKFVGYKYNSLFLPNQTAKLYCSELVHLAYFSISNSDFFTPQSLNYLSIVDNSVADFWIQFYAEHGYKVPQGEQGSHPNNLSLDKKFTKLFFYSS